MNAYQTTGNAAADKTAARLGRIVIIGAAVIEAIVIAVAIFSRHGGAIR